MSRNGPISCDLVRRRFSRQATEYDRYAVVQQKVAGHLVSALPRTLAGPVLDVGTGTGELARRLHAQRPDLALLVSDVAHGMTCRAAAQLPGSLAVDADAQALPFAAESFPTVLSSSVYQWMNDLPQTFAESWRVLKPGGIFAFALFAEDTLFELRTCHRQAVRETGSEQPSHVQEFPDLQQVREALRLAAFCDLRLWQGREVQWHADLAELLYGLKKIGAQNASQRRPAGMASRRVMARLAAGYRERYGRNGQIPATYHLIYALARKA